jgi:Ser/Thr protein kinase RdoA (MazF antagonist)
VSDSAAVGRILREYRLGVVRPAGIRRLSGSVCGSAVAYRVDPESGPPIVVRAFRADVPVPAQFGGGAAETMTDWVVGRARTLARLAEAGYPAPRPVRVRSGELVGVTGAWLTWATTFVDGPLLRPTLAQLRELGTALARLHAVRPVGGGESGARPGGAEPGGAERGGAVSRGGVPGRAAWHPAAAVPSTLARLRAVAGLVPPDWQPMYAAFLRTVQAVQRHAARLPETLVHGDAWAGNAVQAPGSGGVTLIDWETGGLGLPVLDLGSCLAECHLDSGLLPEQPQAWLVRPDEERIAAVVGGYCAIRAIPAAERDLLADAAAFGAAFAGAIHLQAALTDGAGGPAMDARLARLRNRLAVSEEIARLALRHLPPP